MFVLGYRTVYLLSSTGENLAPSSLFVHMSFIVVGYRTVYLLSSTGENLAPSSLFVHMSFIRESEMVSGSNTPITCSYRLSSIKSLNGYANPALKYHGKPDLISWDEIQDSGFQEMFPKSS